MDYNPNSPFLLLNNEDLVELYNEVSIIEEICSEFKLLLREELVRRNLFTTTERNGYIV
ncbi:hypothetical protein [Alkalihalobacillus deserti]|uniref:hypothetical protein n=1 Tax=Alkalihalobacillus deserti TaxID=2879466 RepID=UPI001D15AD10|nr:hypothetical protein [Alkalihalobacillus deserti]